MKKLRFSIDINAPKEKVWKVLWEGETFTDWTSVFAEGSYAVSDWKEGSPIQFIDPASNDGMSSIIEKSVPNQFMSFKHLAEIKNGVVQPLDEKTKQWSGALENYTLTERDGVTTLDVDVDAVDEYSAMLEEKFPQGLKRVKMLAEE